jgi:beta-RFAP synthase
MADLARSVRVIAGARLHFGLFDTRDPFGGVGMMIDRPETVVTVTASDAFETAGHSLERVTQIARRFAPFNVGGMAACGCGEEEFPRCRIVVERSAPEHCGLGSGTQLSLAVAAALSRFFRMPLSRRSLVESIAARGKRSAIGSVGFFEGGMIWEDGVALDFASGDSVIRVSPPKGWRWLITRPNDAEGSLCGDAESRAFESSTGAGPATRRSLRELGLTMINACGEGDFASFAKSLTQFNRRSGELFAGQQGGPYNGPRVAAIIDRLRDAGAIGYGQSSWGPTVFAACQSEDEANRLANRIGPELKTEIVAPIFTGATIED